MILTVLSPTCDHNHYQSNHNHQHDQNLKQLWDGSLDYKSFANIYTFLPNNWYVDHTLIADIKESNKTIVVEILLVLFTCPLNSNLPTRYLKEDVDDGGFSLENHYQ
jgi:hypothetical protein